MSGKILCFLHMFIQKRIDSTIARTTTLRSGLEPFSLDFLSLSFVPVRVLSKTRFLKVIYDTILILTNV